LFAPTLAQAELSNETILGPGMLSQPAYDGSDSQVLEFAPVIRYLGNPWFVRSTQDVLEGGAWVALAPGLHGGVQIAYEPGRKTSQSGFLQSHDVPDVNDGVSIGLQTEWDHMFGPMPVTLLVRLRQHTDLHRGAQLDLRPSAGVFRAGPVSAGIYAQATWADAKSSDSLYGITPLESTDTALPAFSAGSGWLFARFGLLASVDLSSKWNAVGSLESRRLFGDAAHSPLTQRVSNRYGTVGIAYRF